MAHASRLWPGHTVPSRCNPPDPVLSWDGTVAPVSPEYTQGLACDGLSSWSKDRGTQSTFGSGSCDPTRPQRTLEEGSKRDSGL